MPTSDTVTLRINAGASAVYAWDSKDPSETCRRVVDFGPTLDGRTIVGVSVACADVTVAAVVQAASTITLYVQGGADGVPGSVRVQVHADDGTDETVSVSQPITAVQPLAGIDASAPVFVTIGGMALTLGGAPLLCGRTYPAADLTLAGSPLTLGGAPLSLGPT